MASGIDMVPSQSFDLGRASMQPEKKGCCQWVLYLNQENQVIFIMLIFMMGIILILDTILL